MAASFSGHGRAGAEQIEPVWVARGEAHQRVAPSEPSPRHIAGELFSTLREVDLIGCPSEEMQMFAVFRFSAVLLLGISATSVFAAPFYERPEDPAQFLIGSQSFGVEQQATDNFLLPADQVLGHVAWWGGLVGSQRETQTSRPFVVRLFASSGGG